MSCVICQNFLASFLSYSPASSNSTGPLRVQFPATVTLLWFLGNTALRTDSSFWSYGPLFKKRTGTGEEMRKKLGERRKACSQCRGGKGSQLALRAAAFLKALHSCHRRITHLSTRRMKTFINNQAQKKKKKQSSTDYLCAWLSLTLNFKQDLFPWKLLMYSGI